MTASLPSRVTFWLFVALICLFLMLPSLVVIPVSFNASPFLEFPPSRFSTVWYGEYFTRPPWLEATIRSFLVAIATMLIASVLGTLTAFGLVRGRVPFRRLVILLLLMPIVAPSIVAAVGFYDTLARFDLIGTFPGIVLSHTVLALPFVVINVVAVLSTIDWRIEHAARSLGASPVQAFFLVTLPLIRPGIIAGAVFAFITSFDEVVVALYVTGVGTITLPVQMWSGLLFELTPIVASASAFLIGFSAIVLFIFALLKRISL